MFSSHCTRTLHPIVLRLLPLLFCQRKKKNAYGNRPLLTKLPLQILIQSFSQQTFWPVKAGKHRWNIHYNNHDDCISFRWAISRDLVLFMHGVLVPWTEWGYCYRCWTHLYFSCFHMSMGFVVYPNDPHNCFLVTLDPFRQNINVLLKMNPLGVGQ